MVAATALKERQKNGSFKNQQIFIKEYKRVEFSQTNRHSFSKKKSLIFANICTRRNIVYLILFNNISILRYIFFIFAGS